MASNSCWKLTGVWGDRSCDELIRLAHCHHCSTYRTAGNQLLHRAAPPDYKAQQTKKIAAQQQNDCAEPLSALIFRLGREWLALPAHLCRQVLVPLPFHTLPHRSNHTLLGIVNVSGQMLLKVSLLEILSIDTSRPAAVERSAASKKDKIYPRMVVIEKSAANSSTETWVFDVDELYGVHSIATSQLETISGVALTDSVCSVFSWREQRVSFLDGDRLFEALKRRSL